ncbi:MAG: hypothetical protein HYV54_02295 [Parcubacteria group bacterium]|nr:hypothetical protein [Parcubacteria group bacterium]
MSVVVTKEIKKKRIMLAILGALILASVLILYFGFFSGGLPSTVLPEESSVAPLGNGMVSDLNVKILEDERFKNLASPPGVPVATSTTGKKNPFSD